MNKTRIFLSALILLITAVDICEPIKNVYLFFVIGVLLLGLLNLVIKHKITTHSLLFTACWIIMALLPRLNGTSILTMDISILKYEIYIVVMILIARTRSENSVVIKWIAMVGYLHVFATYFFLIVPSTVYKRFAMSFYGRFPIGTENGMKGYTASLCSHYSANALYIAIVVIALWVLLITGEGKGRWRMLIFFIASFIALMLTEKRGHLLFVSVTICFLYIRSNREGLPKIVKRFMAGILVTIPVMVVIMTILPQSIEVLKRFSGMFSGRDISTGRFGLWKSAIRLFEQAPIRGIGWQRFMEKADAYFNVHNTYIQIMCETGMVGLLGYIVALAVNYLTIDDIVRDKRFRYFDKKIRQSLLFSDGIQFFFILYCLTGNCLYDNTLFFYAVASGMGMAVYHNKKHLMCAAKAEFGLENEVVRFKGL